MMTRITATAALALLAACGSASVAEQDASAQTHAAARPLTIAGVRIGMPATEVQAALARDGWKVETFPGYDWATTVEEQKRQQRGASSFDLPRTGLATIQAKKGDEALVVEFRPVSSGAEVKLVKYEAPMAGRTGAQLRAQLTQRYGMPTRAASPQLPLDLTWCGAGEPCRSAYGAAKPALHAKEDVYHKARLILMAGGDTERAWEAQLQRAAGGGASAKSSF
jgi:hypothetical protein